MSKAGKRGKSAQGAGGAAKWENALLSAVFEEVSSSNVCSFLIHDSGLDIDDISFPQV